MNRARSVDLGAQAGQKPRDATPSSGFRARFTEIEGRTCRGADGAHVSKGGCVEGGSDVEGRMVSRGAPGSRGARFEGRSGVDDGRRAGHG